ncbi:hypothetical protein F5884DRAFT_817516 [Xylogone sp. PMI_703]|nr:hypothetical protein F5884DRAFT_817516 [Xylogone sp. PMI_703]
MRCSEPEYEELVRILTENFNILADEVQLLSDRKTILEHKLRFAHEQYQTLADKYAPSDPEISKTIANLQLPLDLQVQSPDCASFVPLPTRNQANSKQHTAIVIRNGRLAAKRLSVLGSQSTVSTTSGHSLSGASSDIRQADRRTSVSTVLEKDFTVHGKQSSLSCPFTKKENEREAPAGDGTYMDEATNDSNKQVTPSDAQDKTPHHSADPICAALYAETISSPPPSLTASATKCPIRFLDQHSPEEVAHYVETHKHEIPRSHEICVKRYQKSEEDIRKLDAKYGNLISMIQGLGQMHQPMLPAEADGAAGSEHGPNDRVESWANDVNATGADHDIDQAPATSDDDRESRFDRPLKEVRVGESPSRPWGISVPVYDDERPTSPPPAPVPVSLGEVNTDVPSAGKCPFDHGKGAKPSAAPPHATSNHVDNIEMNHGREPGVKATMPNFQTPTHQTLPTFVQSPSVSHVPQMIFTGPVFIGYPMEQAIQLMQQYKGN